MIQLGTFMLSHFYWIFFPSFFFLSLSVSSLPKMNLGICLGTNWVGFVVAIGVDWCWYLLLIVYYIWHFYDFAQNATACNGQEIFWSRMSKERKTKPTCHWNTKKKKRDFVHVSRLAKDKSVTLKLKVHPREMKRTQKQWTVIVKLVQENSL